MHQISAIGGGSYCLLNVVKSLDKRIWEPVVALKNHGPLEDEIQKQGVEVVLFPKMKQIPYNAPITLRNLLTYCQLFLSERVFEELLRKEHIDVLYLNNMMIAPYLRPAKRVGCKTVMHVREHWPLNEHKRQLRWVRKIVNGNCDKLIAINHYSASIFPEMESTIVYDWIDMNSRYKPLSMGEIFREDMTGKKVLLYTGGFLYIKGADYVVNTFKNDIKGDDYRLLILGADLNKPLSGLKHKIKKLLSYFGYKYFEQEMRDSVKKDKRIKCIPGIYELGDLIKQSYCFVSYFRIPHANLALAENIILGNPCIAAVTEESMEYTGDGEYAMLVKANSPELFSNKLNEFLIDNEKWKEVAFRGSEIIAMKFNKEKNIQVLNATLNGLIDR